MIDTYDSLIREGADLIGCDWRLFKAQLWQESRLKPEALSPVGAEGIGQIMPPTWEKWSKRAGYPFSDVTDPEANIMTAAHYMRERVKKWSWPRPEMDRHCLALASYNAGFGNLIKAQKAVGGASLYSEIITGLPQITNLNSLETINYVRKILYYYNALITGENIDD